MPNLVRDEWVNVGVLLFDPASGRMLRRVVEEPAEMARVRRLHPAADEVLLRGPGRRTRRADRRAGRHAGRAIGAPGSDAVQCRAVFSAASGLLAEDFEAELDRLYRDHVEPPRYRRETDDLSTRNAIRTRANQVFRSAGIWPRLERRVNVAEFTFDGDPMRVDYAYRRNGTRGFVQALALGRDPGQAKVLAFTAEAIRAKVPKTDFLAVTEIEPRPKENPRHRFVTGLLEERGVTGRAAGAADGLGAEDAAGAAGQRALRSLTVAEFQSALTGESAGQPSEPLVRIFSLASTESRAPLAAAECATSYIT